MINKLIEITGSQQEFKSVIDTMKNLQQKEFNYLGDEFWNALEKKLGTDGVKEIESLLASIYDKYYSKKQLTDIITFYESEACSHMIQVESKIFNEIYEIGRKWGDKIVLEIYYEIQENYESQFQFELNECEEFKRGEFYRRHIEGGNVSITRNDNRQTDKYDGNIYNFEIKWIGPCRYVMKEIREGDFKYNTITVNIYEKDEKGYKYISSIDGTSFYEKGELFIKE